MSFTFEPHVDNDDEITQTCVMFKFIQVASTDNQLSIFSHFIVEYINIETIFSILCFEILKASSIYYWTRTHEAVRHIWHKYGLETLVHITEYRDSVSHWFIQGKHKRL